VKDFLTVGAVFRDEASFLDEWLTFHTYMGVDKFYLFDDYSSDNFLEVLNPWIAAGRVVLNPGGGRQQGAIYAECLTRVKNSTEWLVFIDLDEFLWSPSGKTVSEVLPLYSDFTGIIVRWKMFGSSHHERAPGGGVLRNFTRCLPLDANVSPIYDGSGLQKGVRLTPPLEGKTIFRPKLVSKAGVHNPKLYLGALVDESTRRVRVSYFKNRRITKITWSKTPANVLRINHYWSRSLQEMEQKVDRQSKGSFHKHRGLDFALNLKAHRAREAHYNAEEDTAIQTIWAQAQMARSRFLEMSI
jgi:hypothetical protein